jgi:hypothetical protein
MSKNDKENIRQIIDEFFENASQEDLVELQSLLEKRKKSQPISGINLQAMA